MKITPAILAAAYDLLVECPPFDKWNLPPSEDVRFSVIRGGDRMGDHVVVDGEHRIRVSDKHHEYLPALLETMAHEMIHLHEGHAGIRGRGEHSAAFKKLAAQVCRYHHFDPGQF